MRPLLLLNSGWAAALFRHFSTFGAVCYLSLSPATRNSNTGQGVSFSTGGDRWGTVCGGRMGGKGCAVLSTWRGVWAGGRGRQGVGAAWRPYPREEAVGAGLFHQSTRSTAHARGTRGPDQAETPSYHPPEVGRGWWCWIGRCILCMQLKGKTKEMRIFGGVVRVSAGVLKSTPRCSLFPGVKCQEEMEAKYWMFQEN